VKIGRLVIYSDFETLFLVLKRKKDEIRSRLVPNILIWVAVETHVLLVMTMCDDLN